MREKIIGKSIYNLLEEREIVTAIPELFGLTRAMIRRETIAIRRDLLGFAAVDP